ncbi:protein kinase [Archangium violaceum]|uniref:serine/threonine protein kinase n=1 Tax=Archangium violaceum TaxID=83451 RepID=UPI00194F0751|nr:serine/threonine-protein kinase [Archangium violaceum]QRO01216.1 protein kinase [Archangium violaceum]
MGQRLGEYLVRRCIGSGGMGVVYEGEHVVLGRKVALKLLREEHAKSTHVRDLLTEARAASAIRHHGIIDIFGYGDQQGIGQYLVMELLEGQPLNEIIEARAPLPPAEVFKLLGEVLDALSAAHAEGVIHRDLKPSNIFVVRQSDGSQHVKVLDFGLAKRSSMPNGTTPQTHSNIIVGTPQYIAPEQALGEEVGPRTDLYSLGVIAFEMLTGERPFSGRSHMELVAHHLKNPAPAPSSIVALPRQVDEFILRLLAKQPQQRPASASMVADEMRTLARGLGGDGKTPPARRGTGSESSSIAAVVNAPTSTVNSPAAMLGVGAEVLQPARPRSSRWRWGAAAGGLMILAGGVGLVVGRGPYEDAALDPLPQVQVPVVAVSLSPSSTREPEPEVSSAPMPVRKPASKVTAPVSTSSKKKAPRREQPVLTAPMEVPTSREGTASGTLHLIIRSAWAEVWVDGQKLGSAPPQHRYTLAAGEHVLELRNPAFKPYRRVLVVPSHEVLSHEALLEPTAQVPLSPSP